MVSHTGFTVAKEAEKAVLILIVMDNGLSHYDDDEIYCSRGVVLILIVMDNGLSPLRWWNTHRRAGLNPYCNG